MTKVFTQQDVNPMSYKEFGLVVDSLIVQIDDYFRDNAIKIDLVVPILRSGGVPGSIIAITLHVSNILPIQLKCKKNNERQVLSMPEYLQMLPSSPNILICETNTDSGLTARLAVKQIRDKYPAARIFYATVAKVFGGPDSFESVEKYFYGVQVDENLIASKAQVRELGLREKITIFPWEKAEDELKKFNSRN